MRCFSEQDLVKAELGELTLNQIASLEAHAASCSQCAGARGQIRQLVDDLAQGPAPSEPERFVDRVMAARPAGEAGTTRIASPMRRLFVPLLAAAAVALVALGTAQRPWEIGSHKESWTARGRHKASPSLRTPASEVLLMRAGRLLPLASQSLSPGDAFAVRFVNPSGQTRYLTAFAVDAAGTVHWIFPEYVDEKTDPTSAPLPSAHDEQLLPQVVAPEKPAPGPMRVVSLTSSEPSSVKRVEAALREAPAGVSAAGALARLLPDALIREWSCSWNDR
jgi:anti-sigma factor RsiW